MKIFISHASANEEVILQFASLLESVSSDISVFCSSQEGSVRVGQNFVEVILKELSDSDLFIPVISKEYYDSRFCMIELGIANAYLFDTYRKSLEDYIYPFVLFPVKKSGALSGTPISHLQAGELNNQDSLRNFLDSLVEDKGIRMGANVNRKINSFVFNIDHILLRKYDILHGARPGAYFDDSIYFRERNDVAQCSASAEGITVNFNMNPYERNDARWPNFVSLALCYTDSIDLGRYLDFNIDATFDFKLTSFTNSIKRIVVEFKQVDGNRIIESFIKEVQYGENRISIPLCSMKSNALSHVSEICFVVHPEDVVEAEGMFKISEMRVHFEE